jgi:heparanase 1
MRANVRLFVKAALVPVVAALASPSTALAQSAQLTPSTMPRAGIVDERYQSYNVEMLEVTGGRFWRPYGPELDAALRQPAPSSAASSGDTPSGMNPALYEYRPPLDLTNARLRKLAAALGPAYVRVSGTWANTTYFPETEQAPPDPPQGFGGVLTHNQWRGVVDFSKAVNAEIVSSFATGVGTRNSAGVWTPDQAKRWLDFTRAAGGRIAAAEWMNEPTLAAMGGVPKGYDAAAFGRDFKIFHAFAKQAAPDMLILGPGSVGESTGDWAVAAGYGSDVLLKARDLLAAVQPARVDGFSYHHYGAVSQRCISTGPRTQTSPDAALTEDWLGRTDQTLAFYRRVRDEFEPGKPFWNTEAADAACGGNPWGSTFLDTFRYLDQLGRLAKQEVRVVAHNTLVASDYGLLNDKTLEPKPNYWGALLWRRLMGTTVLDAGVPVREGLHAYAHCLRGTPGGVALLAINNSRTQPTSITVPVEAERYTLTAPQPNAASVQLNGQEPRLGGNDEVPELQGRRVPSGPVELPPASITFLTIPGAGNGNCR